jgi:hypothetical protein
MLRAHDQLRRDAPVELERLRRRLLRFERLRRLYRIEDYHLQARPELAPVAGRLVASVLLGLALLGPATWGLLTSGPAYALVSWWAPRASERFDQYDTNKIVLGIFAYGALWGVELTWFCLRFGIWPVGALFALSLPVAAAAGLGLKGLVGRLLDDARAFLLFHRRRDLQRYLLERRLEIEGDLAKLARRARSRGLGTQREACSA